MIKDININSETATFENYVKLVNAAMKSHCSPYVQSECIEFDSLCGLIEDIEDKNPDFEDRLEMMNA